MPLIRYELKSELSIANPELYKSVSKHDAEALFESITMAALAGIVRQLGEVSEFAAEIFSDLHKEVVELCSRGRKLASRVRQLETQLPQLEESTLSDTDQLRYAFTPGIEWHPTISVKQNHMSQDELPRFIQKSYDSNREPPQLHLLDCFDVAGPGASLKRYTNPSFFRTVWANSELSKAQRAQAGRRLRKPRKQNTEEPHHGTRPAVENNVSLLKASKFIQSVHLLTDPFMAINKEKVHPLTPSDSNSLSVEMETLRISAKEIEATSLLTRKSKFSSASDSDPATFVDSLDQFVDALTGNESDQQPAEETPPKPLESLASSSRPTSSGSNDVDDEIGVSKMKLEQPEKTPELLKAKPQLSFYSSSSPSEVSSPNVSLSDSEEDDSCSQPGLSILDSPAMPHLRITGTSPLSCSLLLSPGSPTTLSEFEEQAPAPPPLPPSKWRINKVAPAPVSPPAPVVVKESSLLHDSLMDSIVSHDKEKLRKVDVGSESRGRSFDNRDVLLEQIRSKSFNLKHTPDPDPSRSSDRTDSSHATADVNVAAILEKASAIRQAFEDSDEEEGFT